MTQIELLLAANQSYAAARATSPTRAPAAISPLSPAWTHESTCLPSWAFIWVRHTSFAMPGGE